MGPGLLLWPMGGGEMLGVLSSSVLGGNKMGITGNLTPRYLSDQKTGRGVEVEVEVEVDVVGLNADTLSRS